LKIFWGRTPVSPTYVGGEGRGREEGRKGIREGMQEEMRV